MKFSQNQIDDISVAATKLVAEEAVNALIKPGALPGNGTDLCAERNGLILATNALAVLIQDFATPLPDVSNVGAEFRGRKSQYCRAIWLEKKMERHYGPDWWQQPYEDIDICRYIAEHFPMMVDGNVVPAYARVRDLGGVGNLEGAL